MVFRRVPVLKTSGAPIGAPYKVTPNPLRGRVKRTSRKAGGLR